MGVLAQNPEPLVAPPDAADRITGWKDVAARVGKSVRTAQRWEKQCGLPVHRITTPNGEVVYAFRTELDEWVRTRDKSDPNGATSASPSEPQPAGLATWLRPRPLLIGATIGALGMLAVGAVLMVAAPFAARTVRTLHVNRGIGPAGWRISDGRLKVYNASDEELWEFRFPFALDERAYARDAADARSAVSILDLENDGAKEVLFIARGKDEADTALFCFDAYGAIRFSVRPHARVRFGGVDYAPPFAVRQFLLTQEPDRHYTIWLVAGHHAWFPHVLQKLTHTGDVVAEYWNNGSIDLIRDARLGSRRVLLVAGSSNEYLGPSVSVLDYDSPGGSAPADNPRYRCDGCAGRPPLASFVVPFTSLWSEINLQPRVDDLLTTQGGYVTVALHGVRADDSGPHGRLGVLWTFDDRFDVLDVEASDARSQAPTIARTAGGATRLQVFPILRWVDGRRIPPAGDSAQLAR